MAIRSDPKFISGADTAQECAELRARVREAEADLRAAETDTREAPLPSIKS